MINTYFIYFVLLVGCNSFDRGSSRLKSINLDPPPPPPSFLPSSLAPNFIPNFSDFKQIQINNVPHPFDINGHLPCSVWINGKKADLTPQQAQSLAKILNLKSYPVIDNEKLHEGIGWLQPLTDIK